MNDPGPYHDHWADLRRRRRIFLILLVLLPLAIGLLRLHWTLALVWLVAILISGNYAARWRCPRCGRHFFIEDHKYHPGFAYSLWTPRCRHCQLPRWARDADSHRA